MLRFKGGIVNIWKICLIIAGTSLLITGCAAGSSLESPDDAYVKLTQSGHPCEYEGFGDTWLGCEHSTGGGRTYLGIKTANVGSLREVYDDMPTWEKPQGCDRVDRPVILGSNWFAVEFDSADRAILLDALGGEVTTAGEAFGCSGEDADAIQGVAEQAENERQELAEETRSVLYNQALDSVERQCETETGSSGTTGLMVDCTQEKLAPCQIFDITCVVNKFFG